MPAGAFTIPTIFTAIDKFSGPIKGMNNALNGFIGRSERLLGRANAAFTKLLTPVTSLNRMLNGLGFYIGIYTLIRALKSAIDVFADFQQAQVDIRAVTKNNIPQTKMLADQARELALRYGETATSILQTDLALIKMGYSADKAGKAAEAILTGSVALKADPEELAKSVAATMQAFKLPAGSEQTVVDMFAKVADISALDWKELQTMLPIAQGAAAITGHSLPEMLALFAAARDAQVHVASGSTAIKNMMIKSGIYDKDLTVMLQKITSSSNSIKTAFKMFGPKTLVTALPLAEAQKLGDIEKTIARLKTESEGYAQFVANIRLDSFRGSQKLLTTAYQEFILSIEDGNGPLAESLTRMLKVASAMFLLSSDSDIATKALKEFNPEVINSAERFIYWLKVIGWVTAAIIAMRIALVLWRAVVMAATIVQGIWSVGMGIAAANGWLNVFAIRGNIIALTSFKIWAWLATAAQNAFNLALKANPIILITTGILGLANAYAQLTGKIESSIAAHKLWAKENGQEFKETEVPITDKLLNMFGLKNVEIGRSGGYTPGTSQWERQNKVDSIAKINPKAAFDTDLMDSLVSQVFKGKLDVNFNDPDNRIDSVKTNSKFVHPRVSSTNSFQ